MSIPNTHKHKQQKEYLNYPEGRYPNYTADTTQRNTTQHNSPPIRIPIPLPETPLRNLHLLLLRQREELLRQPKDVIVGERQRQVGQVCEPGSREDGVELLA